MGFLNQLPNAVSSHEYAQLYQSEAKGKMYTYDYGNAESNKIAYGQPEPILYDVSKINNRNLSFWYGGADSTVSVANIERLIGELIGKVYCDHSWLS